MYNRRKDKQTWNGQEDSMEQKKTSRQLQAEASREKLQQIVMDLCKTRTLDEIRIKDICEQAGMSLGNFYQYFSSKEDALIYSYKTKDDCWSRMRFEEIADPLERVKRIIATHLRSMTENSLCFDTQLYIAQLKQYGTYFFTQDRYITRIMRETVEAGQQAGEFDTRLTASEIVKRLLNFSRGLVYNYCIEHKENHPAWLQYALDCQSEYLTLFLTPKYRESARIEA